MTSATRSPFEIRRAAERDAAFLGPVEAAADEMFAAVGHPELAGAPAIDPASALEAIHAGLVLVADLDGVVVGWVICHRQDGGQAGPDTGELSVGQISVHPDFGRRGIGSALMHRAIADAEAAGETSIVLDTQSNVAWNAPWYRTLGFAVVHPDDWTESMRVIAERQTAMGLDWSQRVHMRLLLSRG